MNYDKRSISCVRAFLYFFLLLRNDFLNLDIMARVAKIEDINSKHNRDTSVSCIIITVVMIVILKTMMLWHSICVML